MEALTIYDTELAVERAGGSSALASDLFGMLVRELPTHRAQIHNAQARNDLDALYTHTHQLHGAAVYTGVPALKSALETLEIRLKRGGTDDLPRCTQNVLREIDRVLQFASGPLRARG
jgi:HPt (histidine-containing phosphotransfer) domain-containing protein